MKLDDGRYECALCGAVLDVPLVGEPQVVIHAASGQRSMRVLSVNGVEVHRCEVGTARAAHEARSA